MSAPIFTKRHGKDKYQVRFWSRDSDYRAFAIAVKKENLILQDVFNDFMTWFCNASASGELNTQTDEWKP